MGKYVAQKTTSFLFETLSEQLFNLPRNEALEKAYKFFEVKPNASKREIDEAYRRLYLKHFPDNGGLFEDFMYVHHCMAVIKAARNEL